MREGGEGMRRNDIEGTASPPRFRMYQHCGERVRRGKGRSAAHEILVSYLSCALLYKLKREDWDEVGCTKGTVC